MSDIGKRIKSRREALGLTQQELANLMGYKSKSTINKIEMGKNDVSQSGVTKFANVLNTSVAYLMGWANLNTNKSAVSINVLGRVAAGTPLNAIEEIIDTEEITEDIAKTGSFFALKIKGDSMEPRIYDGDVVIVRQQNDAENGDIVIAMVNGDDAVCKKLKKYSGGIALISLNSKYEPMMFSDKDISDKPVKILGKVIELRGKL